MSGILPRRAPLVGGAAMAPLLAAPAQSRPAARVSPGDGGRCLVHGQAPSPARGTRPARPLALSSETGHPAVPAVPSRREQGIDLAGASWLGLSGPAVAAMRARCGGTPGAPGPAGTTDFARAAVAASGAQMD
ncbi:hypothetical protein [Roseicella aquatilis]|uniref:Uncharacterized protein n=1 Tax=Roseicella aquatilis TaxID=2527868 RepID=A0A4R4DCW4_9PROT|nr:hypothetical protein [Roseicella aquatilis]TCZ58586.1 hypothetical protein EXY23_16760 [Roseicella aquatilis]